MLDSSVSRRLIHGVVLKRPDSDAMADLDVTTELKHERRVPTLRTALTRARRRVRGVGARLGRSRHHGSGRPHTQHHQQQLKHHKQQHIEFEFEH